MIQRKQYQLLMWSNICDASPCRGRKLIAAQVVGSKLLKWLIFIFFFFVPSDAALASPIPPKVRSHDAAHTPESLALF